MAHSIQSTAVDVFSLPPPFLTNSTVVPLSASSGSFTRGGSPYVFPLSDPPIPLHTHTRHLKQGFWINKPTEERSSKNKEIKIFQRHLLARKTPSIGKKLQLSSRMPKLYRNPYGKFLLRRTICWVLKITIVVNFPPLIFKKTHWVWIPDLV
jgi:hypothetical protein